MTTKLSVVVPCYNEEKRFQKGLRHYWLYLSKQKYPWELIFVNDGSKDNTLKLMQASAKGKSSVKVISYNKNRGKGHAIIQGIKNAKGKYILFTDLDHSVPVDTIESFFKYFVKLPSMIGLLMQKFFLFVRNLNPINSGSGNME